MPSDLTNEVIKPTVFDLDIFVYKIINSLFLRIVLKALHVYGYVVHQTIHHFITTCPWIFCVFAQHAGDIGFIGNRKGCIEVGSCLVSGSVTGIIYISLNLIIRQIITKHDTDVLWPNWLYVRGHMTDYNTDASYITFAWWIKAEKNNKV